MAGKGVKKTLPTNRTGSGLNKEAASIAASIGGEPKKRSITIWPEWSDADINAEKWDAPHKGKEKEKGKSPVLTYNFFDDPEGKIDLPYCMRIDCWKRPADYIKDKLPVIVDNEAYNGFDLLTPNEHVFESELMRWIVGQLIALWKQSDIKNPDGTPGTTPVDPANPSMGEYTHHWRPWEHIYSVNKVAKGPNMPAYNQHGKYAVKLYWLGSWRKIIVDDCLPFDDQGRCLLPTTTREHELWPMLLTKALIKVAALDYSGGNASCEFGDFSAIHCLTSWLPEAIPLQEGHMREIWQLLQGSLSEFKLPEPKPEEEVKDDPNGECLLPEGATPDKEKEKEKEKLPTEKSDVKTDKKDKKEDKKKDDKKDKKDKEKEKTKEKSMLQEEQPLPEHPEVMIFASYSGPPKYPVRVSILREMANASETLRQKGLSHLYPHPVLIMQTRACPLEPPPPPEKVPAWKLIRPRKKKSTPLDEPAEEAAVVEKPIQCVQITSPFINYKVSPVPIPTDIHRPRSSLERGQSRMCSRPGTANVDPIEEADENAPTPEPEPPQVLKVEEPPVETPKEEPPKEEKGSARKKKLSVFKKTDEPPPGSALAAGKSPLPPKKRQPSAGKDRQPPAAESKKGVKESMVSVAVADDALDECPLDETEEEPIKEEVETKSEDLWMDFEEFCKCFKNLYIYHKTHTYPCNFKNSDLKNVSGPKDSKEGQKRTNPNSAVGVVDDKAPSYMFVDSLKQTEIVVSYSCLSRWPDPPLPPTKEESKIDLKAGKGKDKAGDRDSRLEAMTAESSSVIDTNVPSECKAAEAVQPGLLVAEPYSWKSLVTGQPILRMRSSGIRAAVLTLPPGRHVLRFNMTAPLGYHIHLCSSTQFVFGDEEKVMTELTKESCRFLDNASAVMVGLGKCIQSFNDADNLKLAWEEFYTAHCPYKDAKHAQLTYHWQVFKNALYSTLRKCLADANLATPEMAHAWRCFLFDCDSKNPLGLQYGSGSRPATGAGDRGSAKGKGGKKRDQSQDAKVMEYWKNREATVEEQIASIKVQKSYRGYRCRKVKAGRTPGTEDNVKVWEILNKSWAAMEPNADQIGLQLFRTMFKADPDLMPKFPFYKDEWNKITFQDYQGNHPDQPPNTWFVVFREILYVQEEMLCVPKLYVPISTCMLRVINNDTGEEMPRVFQKVAPYVYKKNQKGYTFVAEARTTDTAIQAGKWRMRLIGSLGALPAPLKNDVNGSFYSRELRDYYVPNERNCILRYTVRASQEHLVSIQMSTSKPDVYIKLQVLDQEVEVLSAIGKGHVVIPACIFQKDPDSESKRSESRASNTRAKGVTIKANRSGSATSRSSGHRSGYSTDEEDEKEVKHKYVIQALVMRGSWPLSESQWVFAQHLKLLEKEELKVVLKGRAASPPKDPKAAVDKSKSKDKAKGKAGKDKDKPGSRPASQQFDYTKPNWTLRIVSDGPAVDELAVKKDTDRADEIRAMKRAWEDAEPGRAAKALQARAQYLNKSMIKLDADDELSARDGAGVSSEVAGTEGTMSPAPPVTGLDAVDNDTQLTNEPPPPPMAKEILQPIDLEPFIRRTEDTPRLLDEDVMLQQEERKRAEIQAYRAFREEVERQREQDRVERNLIKRKQLELCEHMQETLDAKRAELNVPREAFRQKYLEAERKRLQEIAAQEDAMRAEMEKNSPTPKGKKSAKDKKSASGKKKK